MLHPDLQLRWINDAIGYGIFARRLVPRGTIIWAQDALDIVLPADSPLPQHPEYAGLIERYCTLDGQGRRVIAWDNCKYINHSCHYNCLATAYGFELAIRDIAENDEITEDYAAFNPLEPIDCACNYPDCRQVIRPGDFEQYWPTWDDQIRQALQEFHRISQPLLKFLEPTVLADVKRYLDTGEDYRSTNLLRYHS
jgi:uncharacterized protein